MLQVLEQETSYHDQPYCVVCDNSGFIKATKEEISEELRSDAYYFELRNHRKPTFCEIIKWMRAYHKHGIPCAHCK